MTKSFLFISSLLIIVGCAHHRDVRPGSAGVHKVAFQTEDKGEGYRLAMSQAEHFCKERGGKFPVVVDEGSKYTGDMDEKSYKQGKTAAKIAQGVGGAAYVFGGKKESNLGGIVGLGGSVASGVMGAGYTFEMKFKCE